jgi:hypothetical protein
MKRAVILHCWGGKSDYAWYPWAKTELEKQGYQVTVPDMPNTDNPKLDKESLENLLSRSSVLQENTMNHTALEFAIDKPEAWLGVQASTLEGGKYITNTESLLTLVNII